MDRFINSFEIDVSQVTADLYDIDPQPNDNYSLLNAHATVLERNIGERARWYSQGDRYYIAVIGVDRNYGTVQSAEGAELEFAHETDLDLTKWGDFKVMQEALIKELKQDLEADDSVQRQGSRAYQLAEQQGFGAISGTAGGFLGGSFGAAGPAVVPYLYSNSRDYPRSAFVGGMAVAYIIPQIVRLPLFIAVDRLSPQTLVLSSVAAVIVLVGLGLGSRLRSSLPEDTFQIFVEGLLLLMAVQLASDAVI